MRDSNFLRLKVEDNVCKRLYVSRPLVCRLRLADGDDTTMSGEDMRRAAHQLRCKDTEFLRHLHVLAQVFFSSLTPLSFGEGHGGEAEHLAVDKTDNFPPTRIVSFGRRPILL